MKPIRKEEENAMQLPKEMKGPSCTHEPTEWTECARCIENYYLKQLADAERRCTHARRRLADAANALHTADVLLHEPGWTEDTRRRILEDYNAEDCASTVFASLKRGKERPSGEANPRAPFAALRELVETWVSLPRDSQDWISCGRGKAFSVLKDAPPVTGSSRDEVVERVIVAVLNELETQKAALETLVGLLQGELGQTKKSLLGATAQAEELGLLAQKLDQQKDTAYAERNELAALVVQMARALGLLAGWQEDGDAEEGWQTLLVVQLPAGQVSWHLPDRDRELVKTTRRTEIPWDGHDKVAARERIRKTILGGPSGLIRATVARESGTSASPAAEQKPHSWRQALANAAPQSYGGSPCWCSRMMLFRNLKGEHEKICERLTALLHEMIKAEEGA